jgi:hypothetical protein
MSKRDMQGALMPNDEECATPRTARQVVPIQKDLDFQQGPTSNSSSAPTNSMKTVITLLIINLVVLCAVGIGLGIGLSKKDSSVTAHATETANSSESTAVKCSFQSIAVSLAASPPLPQDNTSYTAAQVKESILGLQAPGLQGSDYQFVGNTATSFECVDARGTVANQKGIQTLAGTPGGDFSELAAGIIAYHRAAGTNVTEESVDSIFNKCDGGKLPVRQKFEHAIH